MHSYLGLSSNDTCINFTFIVVGEICRPRRSNRISRSPDRGAYSKSAALLSLEFCTAVNTCPRNDITVIAHETKGLANFVPGFLNLIEYWNNTSTVCIASHNPFRSTDISAKVIDPRKGRRISHT
jgi:hypothetical protein